MLRPEPESSTVWRVTAFEHLTIRGALGDDLDGLIELLELCGLSTWGVAGHPKRFVVAIEEDEMVASSGAELKRGAALLRSVAVHPRHRGRGLGRRMVREMLDRITFRGIKEIYLLTEEAAGFFEKRGFRPVDRSTLPAAFESSARRQNCSERATCMRLVIG